MWIDAKKVESEIAVFAPLIKAGVSLAPGKMGESLLSFFEALTDPKTVESVVGVINTMDGATPPPA